MIELIGASALLVIMTAVSFALGRRVTAARVPMQWGFDGKPTWFAWRRVGIWSPVAIGAGVLILVLATGVQGWRVAAVAAGVFAAQLLYAGLLLGWQARA